MKTLVKIVCDQYKFEVFYDYKNRILYEKMTTEAGSSSGITARGKDDVKKAVKSLMEMIGRFHNKDYFVKVYPYIKR